MSDLVVLAFDTEAGATEMLGTIDRMQKMQIIQLEDAATVVRNAEGKTKVKQANSLVPDLRSSKTEGQSNFVNPGLLLVNFGVDFDLTPKLRMVNNWNLLWFDETNVLEQFIFQEKVHHFIGADLSTGMEYRPLLSNNIIVKFGAATLLPGRGFKDIYSNANSTVHPLVAGFLDLVLAF